MIDSQSPNMTGKLTLITPPDLFENFNLSLLFEHLSDEDQDTVSKWLRESKLDKDVNLYVYTGEPATDWLMYAASLCPHRYIDLNTTNYITHSLSGYLLGKFNFYYKVDDPELADVYSRINNNRIDNIETFLENALNDKTK